MTLDEQKFLIEGFVGGLALGIVILMFIFAGCNRINTGGMVTGAWEIYLENRADEIERHAREMGVSK